MDPDFRNLSLRLGLLLVIGVVKGLCRNIDIDIYVYVYIHIYI